MIILLLLVSCIGSIETLALTRPAIGIRPIRHCKIPGQIPSGAVCSVPSRVYSSTPGEEDDLEGGGQIPSGAACSVPSRVYSSTPGEEDVLEGGGGSKPSRSLTSALTRALSRDLSVPAVLLASFLNLLGFTMASPIQPSLGRHFGLPLGASFGSLSSACKCPQLCVSVLMSFTH